VNFTPFFDLTKIEVVVPALTEQQKATALKNQGGGSTENEEPRISKVEFMNKQGYEKILNEVYNYSYSDSLAKEVKSELPLLSAL